MEKQKDSKRVLARRLAKELSVEELAAVAGQGTSYSGTGTCVGGLSEDVRGVDCCDGVDRYAC